MSGLHAPLTQALTVRKRGHKHHQALWHHAAQIVHQQPALVHGCMRISGAVRQLYGPPSRPAAKAHSSDPLSRHNVATGELVQAREVHGAAQLLHEQFKRRQGAAGEYDTVSLVEHFCMLRACIQ